MQLVTRYLFSFEVSIKCKKRWRIQLYERIGFVTKRIRKPTMYIYWIRAFFAKIDKIFCIDFVCNRLLRTNRVAPHLNHVLPNYLYFRLFFPILLFVATFAIGNLKVSIIDRRLNKISCYVCLAVPRSSWIHEGNFMCNHIQCVCNCTRYFSLDFFLVVDSFRCLVHIIKFDAYDANAGKH